MKSRYALYFLLALLPALVQPDTAPDNSWAWFKWGALALYQALLACKALQSPSPPAQ
jgi:hypothetical protein